MKKVFTLVCIFILLLTGCKNTDGNQNSPKGTNAIKEDGNELEEDNSELEDNDRLEDDDSELEEVVEQTIPDKVYNYVPKNTLDINYKTFDPTSFFTNEEISNAWKFGEENLRGVLYHDYSAIEYDISDDYKSFYQFNTLYFDVDIMLKQERYNKIIKYEGTARISFSEKYTPDRTLVFDGISLKTFKKEEVENNPYETMKEIDYKDMTDEMRKTTSELVFSQLKDHYFADYKDSFIIKEYFTFQERSYSNDSDKYYYAEGKATPSKYHSEKWETNFAILYKLDNEKGDYVIVEFYQ